MHNEFERDRLFADPREKISAFTFDDHVARIFPDMIKRSVPGYPTIISMTGVFAGRFAQADSACFDLGCSLGASTLSMRHRIRQPGCRIIAIDNSAAMIERCRQNLAMDSADVPVELICNNIQNVKIVDASFVALNFTLQFLKVDERKNLIKRIYGGLNPGGALLLSEKIHFADTRENTLMNELHLDFKRAQGYSELEIAQKRTALENVLITETIDDHRTRLQGAGFQTVDLWFQCFNFVSFLAIK